MCCLCFVVVVVVCLLFRVDSWVSHTVSIYAHVPIGVLLPFLRVLYLLYVYRTFFTCTALLVRVSLVTTSERDLGGDSG